MTTQTATRISLELGCDFDTCAQFASPLLHQLSKGYERCSVLPVPESVEAWRDDHRTARKRSDRATRLGYVFREIAREQYDEHIYFINTSLDTRQGRPMSAGYHERTNFMPLPEYPCERHAIRTYGVISNRGQLVAYAWIYRCGDLALVSSILGHGEHLKNDVMFLLMAGVIEREIPHGGFLTYNRHDSGTEGLRYYKERCGFEAMEVEWAL